jgi:hypothetical protein
MSRDTCSRGGICKLQVVLAFVIESSLNIEESGFPNTVHDFRFCINTVVYNVLILTSSAQMSPQDSGVGMDHDFPNSHGSGTSASSSDEESLCIQVVDYSAINRLHAWRGWSGQQGRGAARVSQGQPALKWGGGRGLVCKGRGRRALLGGAGIRLRSNVTPLTTSAPSKRSGRFISSRVGATALPMEDIIACDLPPTMMVVM